MARPLPPLNWFRAFEAAARHLKFTAAADELGMTQSAISQQIRSLELRFGAQLFVRKPRGLTLTDDGRKLLPKVTTSLEYLVSANEMFDTGPTRGLLSVATSVSLAQWIIAPNIRGFLQRHPGLRVRILSTIWPDDFKASIADVELRFGAAGQVGRDAVRLPDRLIVVSAPGLAGELADHTLIEAVGTSQGWRSWGGAAGQAAALEPTLFVDSYGMALTLAREGAGIALVSSLLADRPLEAGELVQRHPVTLAATEGYYLATDPESEIAQEFKIWLLDEVFSRASPDVST